jgi:plastocyanin
VSLRATLVGATLAALLLAAGAHAETHVVTIHRMAYQLPDEEVHTGDIIEWINEDDVPHTATSTAAGFDATLEPGATLRLTVTRSGRFDVFCKYHPGMRAVLVVR